MRWVPHWVAIQIVIWRNSSTRLLVGRSPRSSLAEVIFLKIGFALGERRKAAFVLGRQQRKQRCTEADAGGVRINEGADPGSGAFPRPQGQRWCRSRSTQDSFTVPSRPQ